MNEDVSYLYGYGANAYEIEWDIEFLKEKYKDKLNEKVNSSYNHNPTWGELIDDLENNINEEWYSLIDDLESIDYLFNLNYDDDYYLTFDHTHIAKLFPESKLNDLDEVAKQYAKEIGIKNVEIIKWIEWGYLIP